MDSLVNDGAKGIVKNGTNRTRIERSIGAGETVFGDAYESLRSIARGALALMFGVLIAGFVGCGAPPTASSSSDSGNWPTYGGDYSSRRYSLLREIDTGNVSRLVPAYVVQTGAVGPFEATPLVVEGVMYLSTPSDGVMAVNAATGDVLWERRPISARFRACCGPVNRGVAVGGGLVVVGQLDAKLVALDAHTGKPRWATVVADPRLGYSITMAPLIYRTFVLVGVAGGEFGIRGSLSAYSLRDGKLQWRWYATDATHWRAFASSIPGQEDDAERDVDSERADYGMFPNAWKRGGGAIWTTPAIDARRNVVYLSTGNPWPDSVGRVRPGDNLFTECIVALDAASGKLKWYFQEVRHDVRDRDAASPPVLVQTRERGRSVDAVAEVSKTGWLYILDRDTGRLIRRSQNVGLLTTTRSPPSSTSEGGSNWSPISVDPTLGYAIICATHHAAHSSTGDVPAHAAPTRRQALAERYGIASAIDLITGKIVWQDQFDLGLVGGSVSTSGGLTFIGEAFGDFDAIDTRTGKLLWQFQTGAGVNAAPMVFRVGGQEFVAVASGGNRQMGTRHGDAVFVFHLMR